MSRMALALNTGSSSVKFAVAPVESPEQPILSGAAERLGSAGAELSLQWLGRDKERRPIPGADHEGAIAAIMEAMARLAPGSSVITVGHRIVHGGSRFTGPERVTDQTLAEFAALIPLAPLHQPHGVTGIRIARSLFPEALHVACFDTAFHAGKPFEQEAVALPRSYYDAGVRRYGFHGLACQSIVNRLRADGRRLQGARIAIAHLGNGCSVTAVQDGRSVGNSMGFSALDGLAMGTRCGRLDPGVILHLLREGQTAQEIETLLYHQSGLLGLSGMSSDMRDLVGSDDPAAQQAVSYFVARVVEELCRMAGVMGGLDKVIFSGGIGENSAEIRSAIAEKLDFLPGASGLGVEFTVEPAQEEAVLLSLAIAALETAS